jgi:hypothetical protein
MRNLLVKHVMHSLDFRVVYKVTFKVMIDVVPVFRVSRADESGLNSEDLSGNGVQVAVACIWSMVRTIMRQLLRHIVVNISSYHTYY